MSKSARSKALVVAKIKAREKVKPHTWGSKHRGPWDRNGKADGGSVENDDPFAVAASRISQSVKPTAGRQEGAFTKVAEKYVPHAAQSLASLPRRAIENSQYSLDTGNYDPAVPLEAAATMMGGASPFANVSRAGEFSLGVVPVDVARNFGIKSRLPADDGFAAAVRNTPGASIDDGMLRMNVMRGQRPEQELADSVRGGVFYLPQGDKNAKFYTGKGMNFTYGGQQKIAGETAFASPLFVKGATGGKAPEAALDALNGKGAYQAMRQDALRSTNGYGLPKDIKAELVSQFLEKHAPELVGMEYHILQNSTKGNQLAYALQEAAVASAARRAGHDGVVGYSVSRKTKEPFISEVFDVRENVYPSPRGDYGTWDISDFGTLKSAGGSVSVYASGGAVDDWITPDAAPADDWVTPPAAVEPAKAQPTWSSAITEIPSEIAHAAGENWQAVKKAFKPDGQGEQGQFERLANTGKGVMGLAGVAMSPITGTARSLVGHPMAQLEHKAGELIAPEIAAKDDLRKMFETSRGDVDLAMSGMRPAGAPVRNAGVFEWDAPTAPATPAAAPEAPVAPANDVVAAAERASQVAPSPIEVPRAFASDSMAVQRAGQLARNVPVMGDSIPKATGRMVDQMGDTVKAVAAEYGEGSGPNVANRISRKLADDAERETTAATRAAQESDDALQAAWQRDQDAAMAQIAGREESALEAARRATGDMSPQDMGQAVIDRLRAGEAAAKARKEELYGLAGESDAAVSADSVRGVHNRISTALDDMGRVVDAQNEPAAFRMMNELQDFSELKIPNRVGPGAPNAADIAAVDARGMERTRKRLSSMAQAASNDSDRAAAKIIMRQFDEWQADAYENALFSGSQEGLQAFRDARAANAEWRRRFFNDRDDADKIINKVVTGEVTPQEMSNYLVGASQVGSKGTSSRLLTRLGEVTGNDPAAMDAIRGGIANRLFGTTEGVTGKAPAKTADAIAEFFNGSGRDVARRLFTPEQRQIALDYANTLRRGTEAREIVADTAKMTKPSAMEVGPGPMQDLARSVLGRNGKTDEALFSAIDAYARSGARGDIKTLSDIVRSIPEKDRGDLAGAIIRKLGQSKQTNDFSPDIFASEWAKYTPQAKTVLFGNAGPHRQALDDIAIISQRYKDVGRRFGNPSGTAQHLTGFGALSGVLAQPLVAIPSLIGGAIFAKMLSAPASARQTATLLRTSQALSQGVTPQKVIAFNAAANAFARAAERLGSNIAAADFMRLIQGPMPTRAQDEKSKP